ncbi:MAG: hypothetical protein ACYS8Z_09895 [Planctomycetota bacterium]|jgi:hypothetical protein
MSKRKKKFGLQKDFSKIFDGVWIPPKPRSRDAAQQPRDKEIPAEDEKALIETQEQPLETTKSGEQEQPMQPPPTEDIGRIDEHLPDMPQDKLICSDASQEEGLALEMPLPEDRHDEEQADAGFEPNPEIEKIISTMKCSKGFICYKSNFEQLCIVVNPGEGKIIECSPLNQGPCAYRFSFMGKVFCKCPLRYYIAKNLGM